MVGVEAADGVAAGCDTTGWGATGWGVAACVGAVAGVANWIGDVDCGWLGAGVATGAGVT